MAKKKAILVEIVVCFATSIGLGCSNSSEAARCNPFTFTSTPCMASNVVGATVCVNGTVYCNAQAAITAGATSALGGATGSTMTTTTAATGGKRANQTANLGGKTATITGAGGTISISTGGKAGSGGTSATTGAGGKLVTSKDPKIPEISGDCPNFANGTISFGGLDGINIAVGAKAAGPTAPMLVYWHGTGSFAAEYMGMDAATSSGVTAQGGVIVSFQNTTGQGNALCSGDAVFYDGDFMIVDQIVACAVKNYNVDPHKIYVAGCSAGGLTTACMAALRSSYVAAAAPNSGGWVMPFIFQDDHTPALMTRHGAPGVDVVAVDFSTTSKTADDAFKARGGFVINCNHGGMHCGGSVLAAQVWEFFQAHPFGVDPEPWKAGLPADFPADQCKIQ